MGVPTDLYFEVSWTLRMAAAFTPLIFVGILASLYLSDRLERRVKRIERLLRAKEAKRPNEL